jgi:hypothetical protein
MIEKIVKFYNYLHNYIYNYNCFLYVDYIVSINFIFFIFFLASSNPSYIILDKSDKPISYFFSFVSLFVF